MTLEAFVVEIVGEALVWLMILLVPFNWLAAVTLWVAHRQHPHIKTLRDRAQAAVLTAVGLALVSLVAIDFALRLQMVGEWRLILVTAGIVVIASVNLIWLIRFALGHLWKE